MTTEELILERLDRLENQIAPLAESARAIGELREEMTPRVNELVQALIVELADVEADFQIEDLLYLTKKAMRNVNNFSFLLDQLKNLIDFALTAEPLLKSTVPQIIFFLDELERNGVFKMLNTALEVMKKIGQTYSPEEMAQIGDGMVQLWGVLKKLTAPQAVAFLDQMAELPARVDLAQSKPVGLWGMTRAMSDAEIRQGFGVLMEVTRGMAALKSVEAEEIA